MNRRFLHLIAEGKAGAGRGGRACPIALLSVLSYGTRWTLLTVDMLIYQAAIFNYREGR